jgi:hypothetical protein
MDYDEIGGDGLYARDDVVRAEASYYERSDDGAQHYRENVKLTKPVIATDAESKIYKKLGSFEPGEPVPSGLAAALLASFSELQYDGQIVLDQEECASGLAPGTVLNLTGGRAEWAAMRAVVQQVTEDVTLGRTTVTVGPARHLGPADLVTLLRALRSRKVSTGWAMRKTGDSASNGSTVKLGGKDARRDASSGAGTTKNMTLAKKTGENTQKITLDPAEISKTDAGVEIKPRQVYIYDDASGAWKTREVMCSEAFSPSCGETITVVTAVQYDTVSHQLQVKTRSVRLIPAAAESGWTMVSGGQATVCNECEE